MAELQRAVGKHVVVHGGGTGGGKSHAQSQDAARLDGKVNYAHELALQVVGAGLDAPIREYVFDSQVDGGGRGWAFDLCWPARRLAVEVDGAVHRIKKRFKADLEKHQAGFFLGYDVLRVSPAQVMSGEAVKLVARAFGLDKKGNYNT